MRRCGCWSRYVHTWKAASGSDVRPGFADVVLCVSFAQYHANGDEHSAFVEHELFEIQETIRLEQLNASAHGWGGGWAQLVRTPGNRKRLLLILLTAFFSQCSGNGLVSYYIHDILTSVGIVAPADQSVINGALQIWSLLVALAFSVLLVDRLGRRTLFLTAAVGMLVTFSVWTG